MSLGNKKIKKMLSYLSTRHHAAFVFVVYFCILSRYICATACRQAGTGKDKKSQNDWLQDTAASVLLICIKPKAL